MKKPAILCLGEAMVEFVRAPDGHFIQGFGGDTSNAAIAAARQGGAVGYVTAVGADRFGDHLLELWQREGVDTGQVLRDPAAPTGIYFVEPDPDGRHFTYYRKGSAASLMGPDSLDRMTVSAARILHISGISLAVSQPMRSAAMAAASWVNQSGGTVSVDTNLRLKLWSAADAERHLTRAMEWAGIVFTSIDDQQALGGPSEPTAIADKIRQLGPDIVVVTMGGDGCFLATSEGERHIPPVPTEPIDSTGAGDSFAGAFLAWWLQTADPGQAAQYAAIAAAATVSALGAIEAIPDRQTVLARARDLGLRVD